MAATEPAKILNSSVAIRWVKYSYGNCDQTQKIDYDQIKSEWVGDVSAIMGQVEDWLRTHKSHPKVSGSTQIVSEQHLGEYEIPVLEAIFDSEYEDSITVRPVARNYPGRGFIEIMAWPTLRRVYLRRNLERTE